MPKQFAWSFFVFICIAVVVGCKSRPTYVSQKVCDGETCFRGIPHLVYQPHRAVVTWTKPGEEEVVITNHICRMPVTYSVDVDKVRLGKTLAKFEMQGDGSLSKTEADVDHQVDEFISAVGDAAADVISAGAKRGDGSSDIFDFTPPLYDADSDSGLASEGYVISDIQINPLY